ncbi:very short patch repair endonuclease [Hanamia caeni]|jgi:DNA mismatch endonuclease (patch repair protein)|nr:very short patch repair endonuclease [Hanamia caeni]
MADVHSKEMRSYNMSRIKGKNTKPEMLVRKRSERLPSAV